MRQHGPLSVAEQLEDIEQAGGDPTGDLRIYLGKSMYTGTQIEAVITGLVAPSSNGKTGPMPQLWFMPYTGEPTPEDFDPGGRMSELFRRVEAKSPVRVARSGKGGVRLVDVSAKEAWVQANGFGVLNQPLDLVDKEERDFLKKCWSHERKRGCDDDEVTQRLEYIRSREAMFGNVPEPFDDRTGTQRAVCGNCTQIPGKHAGVDVTPPSMMKGASSRRLRLEVWQPAEIMKCYVNKVPLQQIARRGIMAPSVDLETPEGIAHLGALLRNVQLPKRYDRGAGTHRPAALRIGSWGDVACTPGPILRGLLAAIGEPAPGESHKRAAWTSYTHDWRNHTGDLPVSRNMRLAVMASTEDEAGTLMAQDAGFRTFRVRPKGAPLLPNEMECPASDTTSFVDAEGKTRPKKAKAAQCIDCLLCNGKHGPGDKRLNISIETHGAIGAE